MKTRSILDKHRIFPFTIENYLINLFNRVGASEREDSISNSHLFPNFRIYTFESLAEFFNKAYKNIVKYIFRIIPYKLTDIKGEEVIYFTRFIPDNNSDEIKWNYVNKHSSGFQEIKVTGITKPNIKINCETKGLNYFCSENQLSAVNFMRINAHSIELKILKVVCNMLLFTISMRGQLPLFIKIKNIC